jgi:histone H1/5
MSNNSAAKTNFLNSKGRRIFQGKSGGFFVMKADGTKKYKPTAAFRQVGEGAKTKVGASNTNIPSAIARKVRSNAGMKRGPREGTAERRAAAMFNRKPATARKVRKNAGPMKKMAAGASPNSGDLTRMLLANYNKKPAARKPAAKKAGPAKRPGRKPTTVRGMMKAGMTPNEGAIFRNIFRTPTKTAARKPAEKKAGPAKRPGRKPTSAKARMAAGLSPNSGDLTRMLLANYNKPVKARKPAAKKAGPAKRPGRKPTSAKARMAAGLSPNSGDLTRMLLANYNKPVKARKVRANKGKARKAAPKSAVMKKPKATRPVLNLIVVSPGGTAAVQKRKAPKGAKAAMKAGMSPNAGDLTRMLLANYNKKPRKTRKNKGVKRGPRPSKKVLNQNPYAALR